MKSVIAAVIVALAAPAPIELDFGEDDCARGVHLDARLCAEAENERRESCRRQGGQYFTGWSPRPLYTCVKCPAGHALRSRTECVVAEPVTPKPVTPKPVTPKPVTPKPVTPKVTPKPVTPKPVTPKVTPKPVTPKPVTPKPAVPSSPRESPTTPAAAFDPDGPLDRECALDPVAFESQWLRYSDVDTRIELGERSWAAQRIQRTADHLRELIATRVALAADLELGRIAQQELVEYRRALVGNLRGNLVKALIRLSFVTYQTIKSAIAAGMMGPTGKLLTPPGSHLRSMSLFYQKGLGGTYAGLFDDEVHVLLKATGVAKLVAGLRPRDAYESAQRKAVVGVMKTTNSVLCSAVKLGVAAVAGAEKDRAAASVELVGTFMGIASAASVPSMDLSAGEIEILREQHLRRRGIDDALQDAAALAAAMREQLAELDQQIADSEEDGRQWMQAERERVAALLVADCKEQRRRWEQRSAERR